MREEGSLYHFSVECVFRKNMTWDSNGCWVWVKRKFGLQGLAKVMERSRQGQGKVKARSRRGQSKVKVRSRQCKYNLNCNYNLMGFDTIEINLVSFKNEHPAISLQYLGQEFTKE